MSEAANGQEAGRESSETKDSSPKAKDSHAEAAERQEENRESPEAEDGNPEADPVPSALVDLSALRQKVLPALVTVHRGPGRSTGFVIEGGLVVTAYHVAPPDRVADDRSLPGRGVCLGVGACRF